MAPYGGRHSVTGQFVSLYKWQGDTLNPALQVSQGEQLYVRGLGQKWVQVNKNNQNYFMLKKYLNVPGAIALGPDASAFPRDSKSGLIRYTGEVSVPGTKSELMGRAQVWFASAFRTKEVLQVQDPASGALVGKAFSEIFMNGPEPTNHRLDYTIQLFCTDGGYRYVISSFGIGAYLGSFGNVTGQPAERFVFETKVNGKQRPLTLQYKTELYRVAQDVQAQLRQAMSKPAGS
ncbi:hypothetical protein GCM10027511_15530 [Hymenobacter humi]